jgi:ubiquinone/menaquinone biosynthesis C-methylase UbiE
VTRRTDAALPALADLVREIAARAAAAGPLPRGWPYLGLDHPTSTSLDVLADLARHGIFRKYEQVLVLAGGLGAAARWAAATLGCTVVSTCPTPEEARLAGTLTDAAGLTDAVMHVAAATERLPVRDGAVTHVWAVESLGTLDDPAGALAEARRVVRPGGHLAVLELTAPDAPCRVGSRRLRPAPWWAEAVAAAGFAAVAVHDVDAASGQVGARVAAARRQLAARLARDGGPVFGRWLDDLDALTSARAAGRVRGIRIAGRRP